MCRHHHPNHCSFACSDSVMSHLPQEKMSASRCRRPQRAVNFKVMGNQEESVGVSTGMVKSSKTWLLRLSQPAHLVALLSSVYLGFLFFPREQRLAPHDPSTVTSLLYLACFATHYGTQFWMTFASGLILFFSLPRNIFGKVQKCLFPKYFMVNALFSAITLALFIIHHPTTAQGELKMQTWTLLLCFLSELGASLYVVPGLLKALEERMRLEEEAGVGTEIGCHRPGPLAHCPQYALVNTRFRRYHAVCACCNVLSMACSTMHLYFLSTRLRSALT